MTRHILRSFISRHPEVIEIGSSETSEDGELDSRWVSHTEWPQKYQIFQMAQLLNFSTAGYRGRNIIFLLCYNNFLVQNMSMTICCDGGVYILLEDISIECKFISATSNLNLWGRQSLIIPGASWTCFALNGERAANNSWLLDTGRPNFAGVWQNPTCVQTFLENFFFVNHFQSTLSKYCLFLQVDWWHIWPFAIRWSWCGKRNWG